MRIFSSSPALWCAFYGEGAEFRILVANLTSLFVRGSVAPRLRLLKAIPRLNSNTGRWRRSLKRCSRPASNNLAARSPDACLGDRNILFDVGVVVRYLDFANGINRRFCLSMQALHRDRADGDTCDHREGYC